jgi:deoxyribodipyrimidine photo-lyase
MRPVIVWFRRDLRLTDHPALTAAVASGQPVVPVYVHAPEEEAPWSAGGASRWWLDRSLTALAADLASKGSRLIVRRGPSLDALRRLASECGASRVVWNRAYEPVATARDTAVKTGLREAGIAADSQIGNVLFEPWTVRSGAGTPFRVFTPFWKHCVSRLSEVPPPTPAPGRLPPPAAWPDSLAVADLDLAPRIRWDQGLASMWTPGEQSALSRLDSFLATDAGGYSESRDRPDRPATSRLAPALHFGELSPRQILAATHGPYASASASERVGIDAFVREVGWREFAIHILYAFPHTPERPLDERFSALAWRSDEDVIETWRRGRTGIPIVDAGLRELWHTGWMHNRVRMVVASWLTKNLGQHWLHGARWFHDTLVDADLAANTLGWQWTAGCGADAAPYYRIFNPLLQAERFDPDRQYIRRWVPELSRLPDAWIHQPFNAPANVLAAAGVVLDRDYPRPLVDLRSSRVRALAAYDAVKAATPATRA